MLAEPPFDQVGRPGRPGHRSSAPNTRRAPPPSFRRRPTAARSAAARGTPLPRPARRPRGRRAFEGRTRSSRRAWCVATPTETVEPDLLADRRLDLRGDRFAIAEQGHRARHVEERLVDRDRFDGRREPPKDVHHVAARDLVSTAIDRQEDAIRASPVRLAERHGRANAELAGLVAGGRDDPARILAAGAAHDDRSTAELRPVALLDGGEERVEVDVEDRPAGHALYHRPAVQVPTGAP